VPADYPSEIILATRNQDKVKEINAIFDGFPIPITGLDTHPSVPEIEETGTTLEENAILKARTTVEITGYPAMADDSGLFVRSLGGEPGVFSARFAGEDATYADNNKKLLEMMTGTPREERDASFICVVGLVLEDGEYKTFRGEVAGIITEEISGQQGFGYDPVFFHPPSDRTFAQLSRSEKNLISHRYLAFQAARKYMETIYGIE
jgi:XTP/dITP diphosphohydrolase